MFSHRLGLPALLVIAASGCSENQPDTALRPLQAGRVIVEPVRFERIATQLEAVGTSRALRSADLHPVTSGEVVAVNFEPGQAVTAGETLVELDSREQALAVRLAEVRLADAERLLSRYQRSADSGAVLPTVIDEAETAVQTARIELEQARVALDYRSIEAPFGGYVGVTEVDPGDRIGPTTLITTLDDRSEILVSFEVPEAFVGELLVGDSVDMLTWQERGAAAAGDVVDIGSRIDPQTRTFVVRARIRNDADEFRPGMSFRVAVRLEGEAYPVVAETGVQWGADGAFVWSVDDGRAVRIPVEVIQRREGRILVDGGLESGSIVVVEGIQNLRNGIDVHYEQVSLEERSRVRPVEAD